MGFIEMYAIIRALVYIVVVILCVREEKTLLSNFDIDGFTYQIKYVRGLIDVGISPLNLEPLLLVHYFRFIATFLIDYLDQSQYAILSPMLLMALMEPLHKLFRTKVGRYIFIVLVFAPYFLSFRSSLSIFGIGYLMLYMKTSKNILYLVISALFVNLSSGSVLVALVGAVIFGRTFRAFDTRIYLYLAVLSASFIISAFDKYVGFSLGTSGYAATEYDATGLFAIISRSTIYISFVNQQYARAMIYVIIISGAIFSIIFSARSVYYRNYAIFLVCCFPVFLLEGLGVLSLIIPIALMIAREKLPVNGVVEPDADQPLEAARFATA